MNKQFIIAFPHPPGSGGPGSFQIRFEKALKSEGHEIIYANSFKVPDIVFVVGGTKKLYWLWKLKRKGIPILYRLDGINWLHKKRKLQIKAYLVSEMRNLLNKTIHGFLADKIVYQSDFVKSWWNKEGWVKHANASVIYNGVPQSEIKINYSEVYKDKRLVILEGTIDYSPYAVKLINHIADRLPGEIKMELYGRFEKRGIEKQLNPRICYCGVIDRDEVINVFSGAVYLSLDVNPACPNTVIEAMSAGAPVIAFDTGAIPELLNEESGFVVPYGSDPWKLFYPDVESMISSILLAFSSYERLSKGAINNVYHRFNLDLMLKNYLFEIFSVVEKSK